MRAFSAWRIAGGTLCTLMIAVATSSPATTLLSAHDARFSMAIDRVLASHVKSMRSAAASLHDGGAAPWHVFSAHAESSVTPSSAPAHPRASTARCSTSAGSPSKPRGARCDHG